MDICIRILTISGATQAFLVKAKRRGKKLAEEVRSNQPITQAAHGLVHQVKKCTAIDSHHRSTCPAQEALAGYKCCLPTTLEGEQSG